LVIGVPGGNTRHPETDDTDQEGQCAAQAVDLAR
jgi:hypothetical protein